MVGLSSITGKISRASVSAIGEYARLVRPVNEVIDKDGRVISGGWTRKDAHLSRKMQDLGESAKVILRGFYRDDNGVFRLITEPESKTPATNSSGIGQSLLVDFGFADRQPGWRVILFESAFPADIDLAPHLSWPKQDNSDACDERSSKGPCDLLPKVR